MSKKEIIAIDIDDVLSSQVDIFIEFSNENFGTSFTREDFNTPGTYWGYFRQLWGVSHDEDRRRVERFLEEGYIFKQSVEQETKNAINHLKKSYELEIVTSRPARYQKKTFEWLNGHFPKTFKDIRCVELWDERDEKATKARVCKEIGAGYLIDDNAEHCNLAAEEGVRALLFGEFGWNSYQTLHKNVTRAANWKEVLDYFDAKS